MNKIICFVAITLAVVFGTSSLWMKAKSVAGQAMLEHAWQRSVGTGVKAKAWPWADTWPVAKLKVRNGGPSLVVLQGVSGEAMAFGPGLVSTSSATAAKGTMVIGGHRDSHLAFMKNLNTNDVLQVTSLDGHSQDYQVTDLFVANSDQQSLTVQHETHALVLITCYPFNALQTGGPLRYVVVATPVIEVVAMLRF